MDDSTTPQHTIVRTETANLTGTFVYDQYIVGGQFRVNTFTEHCLLISYNCLDTGMTLFVDIQFSAADIATAASSSNWMSVCQKAEGSAKITLTPETFQDLPGSAARKGYILPFTGIASNKCRVGVKETGGSTPGAVSIDMYSWSNG